MMRILIVNTVYGYGSTGKITKGFVQRAINQGYEVALIYADGKAEESIRSLKLKNWISRKGTIFAERITGLTGCFSPMATKKALHYIDVFKPDVIYLGNLHGFYINIYELCIHIANSNIPCVQIMWDEYSMTGGCAFSFDCNKYEKECNHCNRLKDYPQSYFFDQSRQLQQKKKKAYSYGNMAFVSVPYTISKARKSSLLKNQRLFELDEAVDQNKLFYPKDVKSLQEKLGIKDDTRIILNVCVYPNERKGGQYYIELAKMCNDIKDLVFIHVGFQGKIEECPENFIPIGFVKDQESLSEYYSLADLFVCTSLAETQPNTCLESLSCGTPICGFDISGIPTCANEPYGTYVEFGNVGALKEVVARSAKKTSDSIKYVRKYAEGRFSSEDYNDALLRIGKELILNDESE